ncbi:MAG: hypothetical protein HRU20_00390 [Pseudomonadales bacterium]|nr:hypothetical protein [Pseudomonadales bacterium]
MHSPLLSVCDNSPITDIVSSDELTSYKTISRNNNDYEFYTNKEVVHILAKELITWPWHATIDDLLESPLLLDWK